VVEYKNPSENFQELIEAVRAVNAIEQVIAEHVQLRRSGAELLGRCPFHEDKTPSFSVRPAKGVFCCHGCDAGGDVFRFIQLLHKCGFREAVSHLAKRAGIELDGFKPSPELTAKVQARRAEHEEELQFKRFCDERIEAVNRRYRSLGRAATNAEDYLRTGQTDPYLHDLAWNAIERFLSFEIQVDREGLCDVNILRAEWSQRRAA
jgi:DNA primase